MNLRAVLSACALVVLGTPGSGAAAGHVAAAPPSPVVLDNGARVILVPVPGATRVAVEVVHHVGSINEPAGMPQLAHLVEHLTCYGASAGAPAGEAFATGNARGSVTPKHSPTSRAMSTRRPPKTSRASSRSRPIGSVWGWAA